MKRRLILFIIAGVMTLAIPGCKNREAESPGSATEVMKHELAITFDDLPALTEQEGKLFYLPQQKAVEK